MTNGGEPLPGASGEESSATAAGADLQIPPAPEEPLPTLPLLYRINYEGKPLKDIPEAARLTDAIGHINTVQHYVRWRLDNSGKTLGDLGDPMKTLGEYEEGFEHARSIFEFALKAEGNEQLEIRVKEASRALIKEMRGSNFTDKDGMDVEIPDRATLLALGSSEMLEQLLHDARSPLTAVIGWSQMPRRALRKQHDQSIPEAVRLRFADSANEDYDNLRASLEAFPTKVRSGMEAFLNPFILESFRVENIESTFKGVAREKFALAKMEVGNIPNITFAIDSDFRKNSIQFYPFLLGSIVENTVSNYVKKVRAMRRQHDMEQGVKPPNFRTPFTTPRMTVGMTVENGEFVMNIDDTGFPFSEEAIEGGFEGMRERGEHGYLRDPRIETLGIGNAGISEIFRTKFSELQATWRPQAMTFTNEKGEEQAGARVQLRMKWVQDQSKESSEENPSGT